MRFKNFIFRHSKSILIILILILFVLAYFYYNLIFHESFAKEDFANQAVRMTEQNETPIFKVHKILLYSSANAVDKSENESLKDLSICQYTDIAIYIDNTSTIYDITPENTVKKLYIDNIKITPNSNKGHQYVNYKNALDFAKYKDIPENESDKIEYTIINTNEENEKHDYSSPTFYTDCSNPITLEYMNKDIITNFAVSNKSEKSISFNGKILKEAGINLQDINYSLSFNVNIINHKNEHFICNVKLEVELNKDNGNAMDKGYLYENTSVSGSEYNFFKFVR